MSPGIKKKLSIGDAGFFSQELNINQRREGTVKKMVLIAALICLATLGVNHKAQAEAQWVLCTVTGAGAGSVYAYAYLSWTSPATPSLTAIVTFDPNLNKELLAIALTAMASTQKVRAYFDPNAVSLPPNNFAGVGWMYVSNE